MFRAAAAVFSYQCLRAQLCVFRATGLFDLDWLTGNGRRTGFWCFNAEMDVSLLLACQRDSRSQKNTARKKWAAGKKSSLRRSAFNLGWFRTSAAFQYNYFNAEKWANCCTASPSSAWARRLLTQDSSSPSECQPSREESSFRLYDNRVLSSLMYSARCPNDNHNVSRRGPDS